LQDVASTTLVEHIVQYARDNPVRLGLEISAVIVFGALGIVIEPVVGIVLGVLAALLVYYKKPDEYLIKLWQRWRGRG
jgi:predicted histidine transporter YuiF (NhaC family)